MFLDMLEESYTQLEATDEEVMEWVADAYDGEHEMIQEELGLTDEERDEVMESMVRRVSSDGTVVKVKNATLRKIHAARTTGMSKAALRMRAKKASKTKRQNPAKMKKALKKRMKAMKRRSQMGIK